MVGSRRSRWILVSQVGYPLANGRNCLAHRASSYRFVTEAESAVSHEVNKEEGELVFLIANGIEARGSVVQGTELCPMSELGALGALGLGSVGSAGDLERSAEISLEVVSDGRCSSRQGLVCG